MGLPVLVQRQSLFAICHNWVNLLKIISWHIMAWEMRLEKMGEIERLL